MEGRRIFVHSANIDLTSCSAPGNMVAAKNMKATKACPLPSRNIHSIGKWKMRKYFKRGTKGRREKEKGKGEGKKKSVVVKNGEGKCVSEEDRKRFICH